jgi:hypothetical protein
MVGFFKVIGLKSRVRIGIRVRLRVTIRAIV